MTSLLNRLLGRVRTGSGATAKNRLHFVLQHDRINLPPERAEEMKKEILAVIVKYLAVDENRVEIALEQRDRSHSKLVAEIPIVNQNRPSDGQQRERAAAAPRAESNGVDKAPLEAEQNDSDQQDADDKAKNEEEAEASPSDEQGSDEEKRRT